ncbi:hypothetical protein Tco_0386853 [Tanacetum coccineum]
MRKGRGEKGEREMEGEGGEERKGGGRKEGKGRKKNKRRRMNGRGGEAGGSGRRLDGRRGEEPDVGLVRACREWDLALRCGAAAVGLTPARRGFRGPACVVCALRRAWRRDRLSALGAAPITRCVRARGYSLHAPPLRLARSRSRALGSYFSLASAVGVAVAIAASLAAPQLSRDTLVRRSSGSLLLCLPVRLLCS